MKSKSVSFSVLIIETYCAQLHFYSPSTNLVINKVCIINQFYPKPHLKIHVTFLGKNIKTNVLSFQMMTYHYALQS